MNIYKNISQLERDAKFISWSRRIAYNTCLKILYKEKVSEFDDNVIDEIPDETPENDPYLALFTLIYQRTFS